MVVLVSLPLLLEVQEVMRLWLKKPPTESPFLCCCVLVTMFLDKITSGERIAIAASGRMAAYQIGVGVVNLIALPAAWLMMKCGLGLVSVGYATLGIAAVNVVQRVVFAQRQADVPAVDWIRRVVFPVLALILVGAGAAAVPLLALAPSFGRVALTLACSELAMVPFAWFAVVDADERAYVLQKIGKFCGRWWAETEATGGSRKTDPDEHRHGMRPWNPRMPMV